MILPEIPFPSAHSESYETNYALKTLVCVVIVYAYSPFTKNVEFLSDFVRRGFKFLIN